MQRDRLRAVLLAIERGPDHGGAELTRERIARTLGRSRQFVDAWTGRYRRLGLGGLERREARGNPPSLTPGQQAAFRARLLAGPTAGCARSAAATRSASSPRSSGCRERYWPVEPRKVLADDWDQALADAADRMAFD